MAFFPWDKEADFTSHMCAFQQPSYPVYLKRHRRQRRPADIQTSEDADTPLLELIGESEDIESPQEERCEVPRDTVTARDITILRREFEGRYEALAVAAAGSSALVLAMEGQADILEETCERMVNSVDEARRMSKSIGASAEELEEIAERLERETHEAVKAARAAKMEMERMNGRSMGIVHRMLLFVVWLVSLVPSVRKAKPAKRKVVFAEPNLPC